MARQGFIKHRHRSDGLYVCTETYVYRSHRYEQTVVVYEGTVRDGASGAVDIESDSWWVHDQLCADGAWNSGEPVSAWEAATVLRDILQSEGRWFRAFYWRLSTFFFGCKRAKENGWFKAN